jgi:hypothetical protein
VLCTVSRLCFFRQQAAWDAAIAAAAAGVHRVPSCSGVAAMVGFGGCIEWQVQLLLSCCLRVVLAGIGWGCALVWSAAADQQKVSA